MDTIYAFLIACVPAIISAVVSVILAKNQTNAEIKRMQTENKHDLEQLMEQHRVDIDAIREQHRLEMEAKEQDHQNKIELMRIEHENEIIRKEHELENTAKFNTASNIMSNMFSDILGGVLKSPELQNEITKKILDGVKIQDTPGNG